jgi:prolyl-tRNA synthetase
MFAAAQAFLRENTKTVSSLEELYERARTNAGFSAAGWCGDEACETKVKNESRATIRCLPFDQPADKGMCVACGKPATEQAVFSRAY